jgi:hypothetical protein
MQNYYFPGKIRRFIGKILEDIVSKAINQSENNRRSSFEADETFLAGNSNSGGGKNAMVQPLHSHVLLYTQVSDSRQILFSMQCLKNIIQVGFFFFREFIIDI